MGQIPVCCDVPCGWRYRRTARDRATRTDTVFPGLVCREGHANRLGVPTRLVVLDARLGALVPDGNRRARRGCPRRLPDAERLLSQLALREQQTTSLPRGLLRGRGRGNARVP